jgi:chromosome segregation ATPase
MKKKVIVYYSYIVAIPIFLLSFLLSCATMNTGDTRLIDQLKAENRVCSQNLNLFMRENDVLKAENAKYKKENNALRSSNTLLKSDIGALQTRYKNDIAMWDERYNTLQQKYDVFVKQSDAKVQELTALNKTLEKRMADEIARLNEVIRKQEVDFIKEKETIINQNAKKEMECQSTIDTLQKQVTTLTQEKEQLKSKLTEMEITCEKLKQQLDVPQKDQTLRGGDKGTANDVKKENPAQQLKTELEK